MKALISTCLAALIAVTGCATSQVQYTDKNGNTATVPTELYAVMRQQEFAERQTNKACDKINEPMPLPEGIDLDGDSAAWAVAMMAVTHGQAKEDCADAMAEIARANKPSDYLRYKLEDKKATWNLIFKGAGIALTAGCLFKIGGICQGGYGDGGGNTYGDNWVFNQSAGGSGSGGPGGEGGGELSDGGEGAPGYYRPSNNINFGHGNVMGSDLSGSLAGMNENIKFATGAGVVDDSTDNSDNRNWSNQASGEGAANLEDSF